MWRLWFVTCLVACEHRPPPPKASLVDVTSRADAGAVPAGRDVCLQIGAKIADIIISSTEDPTQRAAYEQERTKLVKRFSENCTNERWPDATRACFLGAKTSSDVDGCSRDLAKLQPATPPAAPPASPPTGVN